MQLTSIRKMKCLLVPLELEEFLYHRRKSYLAYKVTCRGKKINHILLILSNWMFLQYLDFLESRIIFTLLFLFIKSFKLGVSHESTEKALTWNPVLLLLSLQCFGWNEVDHHSWYMKGWGFCLWDYLPFLVFFSSNIHYGYFFFLEVNFVPRLSLN